MIELKPIKNSNLNLVADLLEDRNNTLREYTEWKYKSADDTVARGSLIFYNNECAGCFGLVPKHLKNKSETINVGWFADWYVKKEYRKYGLGEKLLQSLNTSYSIVFGHPGPEKAQQLCLSNGYQPLPYQMRLRYVLNKWQYIKGKSGVFPKQLLLLLKLNIELKKAKKLKNELPNNLCFSEDDTYTQWIKNQPSSKSYNTLYKEYKNGNTNILYILFNQSGNTRGKIVDYTNISTKSLRAFLDKLKVQGVEYIDVFSSDATEIQELCKLPCIAVNEAPIMVYGLDATDGIKIKGIDRENWTFTAN